MQALAATIDTYLQGWNEKDPGRRAQLVQQAWTAEGTLTDPPLAAQGWDQISAMAAALQGQFPDHRSRRSTEIDEHHGRFRFSWELVSPDGSVAIDGMDIGHISDDGRIEQITGFFGALVPVGQE